MNKVIIVGKVPQDYEVRYTPKGKAVCYFSVAVNYITKVREEIDYIDCVAWDTLAENVAGRLVKGSRVAVAGRLHTRHCECTDGNTRKVTEVVARDVEFFDSVRNGLMMLTIIAVNLLLTFQENVDFACDLFCA